MFTFLDGAHCVKLVRNWFGSIEVFHTPKGKVNFSYVRHLFKLQEEIDLKIANKLTYGHINYHKRKMKVKFAVQLLSQSVADALQLCLDLGN